MDMAYSERKFTELVLSVADRLRTDRAGGATKVNKVVFFAEFTHLRRHRSVISGCEFQKLAHGPAPRQLLPVRQRLIEAGHAGAHHRGLPRASPAPAGPYSPRGSRRVQRR
jgi:hypothetical protein